VAKVTFRYPSKKIQYGYAEVEFDVPSTMSNEELGREYTQAVLAFQAAEIDAFEAERKQAEAPKPVNADVVRLIGNELGATVISEETKPWDEPAAPAAQPWKDQPTETVKPWEGTIPSFDFGN